MRYGASHLSLFLVFLALSLAGAATLPPVTLAAYQNEEIIPAGLQEWKSWVLHGSESSLCPTSCSNGETYICAWPSRLQLKLEVQKGNFSQEWLLFAKSWVPLPGATATSGGNWPQDVSVDGKKTAVIDRQGVPSIHLDSGSHRVEGNFLWAELPETMQIPAASGLVELAINGQAVDSPVLDANGRLWLQKRKEVGGKEEDRVDVRIYRLLNDTIPMQVTNVLKVNVSGHAREIRLADVLLEKSTLMGLRSSLPARLSPDGSLLIQARPGRFEIGIETRMDGPVNEIGPVKGAYGQEVWAFNPQSQLRMVEIEGAAAIDPNQTDVPSEWKKLSTYIVKPDSRLVLKQLRRGDPDPAPDQLHLVRTWWLDFNGRGYTIQDRVTGTMSRRWDLSMNPPVALGRVSVDGIDQLVTSHGADRKPGVELRQGKLNLLADSRIEGPVRVLPAVGWDHNFQSVSGTLNLPPGWRLLSASGVDVMPGSWFERWTLLDLFLVLIIAMAVFQLYNWIWGLVALVTLALIYHEPDSPHLVWLHLLAASALLRFLPVGRIKKLVQVWWFGSMVWLIVFAVPFMIEQVRWGIYPQLETRGIFPGASFPRQEMLLAPPPAPAPAPKGREGALSPSARKSADSYKAGIFDREMAAKPEGPSSKAALAQDPHALIQTGPGLPNWQWKAISMRWNGPVDRGQQVSLWLLSPTVNLVLAFLRVILLAGLIVGLIGPSVSQVIKSRKIVSSLILFLTLASFAAPKAIAASNPPVPTGSPAAAPARTDKSSFDYPPADLLEQLKKVLLEKPDCLPNCAHNPRMDLSAGLSGIRMILEIHAGARVAVPLPGSAKSWLPEQVFVDDKPAEGLWRDSDGQLWLLLKEGVHKVILSGKIPSINTVQIPLALKPDQVSVKSESDLWEIRGVHPDGQVEPTIQLIRHAKNSAGDQPAKGPGVSDEISGEQVIEPFFHVERTLLLGLNWQIRTTVTRVTPTGVPAVLSIPLLKGESVTTAGIRTEEGHALVHFEPGDRETGWESSLDAAQDGLIELKAPESVPWTEAWTLDASPIWHCELSGIPVIHHQDQGGYWRPQWQPWPGEGVKIVVSRPQAIPGQIMTIDSARLEWTPGMRFSKAGLNLKIRSSQGGQYKILLPENAVLQALKIGEKSQPVSPGGGHGRELVIPLQPGAQDVNIEWHQEASGIGARDSNKGAGDASGVPSALDGGFPFLMKSPSVDLGQKAVNAAVTFKMPSNRWILLAGGPRLGPAVLFWSYLVVVILVAYALGRTSIAPLKTRHWLLLGLGLTPMEPFIGILVVGWLLVLGLRKQHPMPEKWLAFDAVQLVLTLWTFAALYGLYLSVKNGLLGIPDMQIAGNDSSDFIFNWTQDRIDSSLPVPWVFSLPLYVYRILMLLWALWLAQALLRWLRWGWQCFNEQGLWKKRRSIVDNPV